MTTLLLILKIVFANIESVTNIDSKLDEKVNEISANIDQQVETINSTVAANKSDIEDKLESAKTELADSISSVEDAYKDADTALNTKIDIQVAGINSTINDKVDEVNDTISDNKTNIEAKLSAAKAELAESIEAVEDACKEADANFKIKYDNDAALINTALAGKANVTDVYTKAEVNQKVSEVDMSDNIYTKDEINALMDDKADIKDVYKYTEAQISSMLADKTSEILGFTAENLDNKNQANGYAGLDANGKISVNLLPDTSRQQTFVVTDTPARLALTGLISGMRAFETETGDSYIYDGTKWVLVAAANWENVNLDWNNLTNIPENVTNVYTKTESDEKFAPIQHTHSALEITTDENHMFMTAEQARSLSGKADLNAVYEKDTADSLFVKKADFDTLISTYTDTEGMNSAISEAVNVKANVTDVYTKSDVNNLLADKADETEIESVNQTITDAKVELENKITDLSNSVDEKLSDVNSDIDDVKDSIESVNTNLTSYVDGKVVTINENIDSAKAELEENISVVAGGISSINDLLASDYEKAADIAVDIETAKNEVSNELNNVVQDLEGKIDAVDQKVENVDSKYDEKVTAINDRIAEISGDVNGTNESLTNYAKKSEVTAEINGAIEGINTTLTDYAKSTDVTTEINETVDTAIAGVLETINNALNPDGTSGNEIDVAALAAQTSQLITDMNNSTTEKITTLSENVDSKVEELNQTIDTKTEEAVTTAVEQVRTEVIKEVITQEIGITNINDLASKDYVDEKVAEVSDALTETTKTINASLGQISDDINTINDDITDIQADKQDKLGYTAEDIANKDQANGYAGLDENGKVKLDVIPDLSLQRTYVVSNSTERMEITDAISGSKAYETSTGNSYIYNGETWLLQAKADWENVNLNFNNISNPPTTIAGYGIKDAYTKLETDSIVSTQINAASATINGTINSTKAALESSISAGDSTLDGKINTANSNISLVNTKIDGINTSIGTINENIESINTVVATKANKDDVYTKDEVNGIFDSKDTVVAGVTNRVVALENDITTKANIADVYTINDANDTFATKSTVSAVDKKVDDLNDSVDNSFEAANQKINANAESIDTINNSINSINSTIATLAVQSEVETALNTKVTRRDIFDTNGVFNTTVTLESGNFGKLFNESDGGGSQAYAATSDVISFAGTNTDTINLDSNGVDQAINVQLYAKFKGSKVGTANFGTRLNMNTNGLYYLKGTVKTNSVGREVAVKEDVSAVEALITALTTRVSELENTVQALVQRVEALENA